MLKVFILLAIVLPLVALIGSALYNRRAVKQHPYENLAIQSEDGRRFCVWTGMWMWFLSSLGAMALINLLERQIMIGAILLVCCGGLTRYFNRQLKVRRARLLRDSRTFH